MGIASLFCYIAYTYVLVPGAQCLNTIAFIFIIASLVQFVNVHEEVLPSTAPGHLPPRSTNCAVLGVALLNEQRLQPAESVLSACWRLASGGHRADGGRGALESSDIPKAFKGFSIILVIAGLMAMAFLGFSGLVK